MKKSELREMIREELLNEGAWGQDIKKVLAYLEKAIGDSIKANMGQNGGDDPRSKQKHIVANLRVAKKAIKAAQKGTKSEDLLFRDFMLPKSSR